MMLSVRVTHHAMRRYIERVMGCDLEWPLSHGYGELKTVRWAAEAYGFDVDELKRTISLDVHRLMSPTSFVRGHHRRLRGERCVYVIEDGFEVVSVLKIEPRKHPRDTFEARHS